MSEQISKVDNYIDSHKDECIQLLREAVALESISSSPAHRPIVIQTMKWFASMFEKEGAKIEFCDIGQQTLHDGTKIALPPIILGELGNDPKKHTLLIYGHLDVQPVQAGWDTEPFKLTEKDGKLFGRGATDDKGPVIGWLNCIKAFNETKTEIPINLKFCFEGMEESGSEGLQQLIENRKDYFKDVDYVCISDSYFLGPKKPCVTYGLRGMAYFHIEVECSEKDLHSGIYGGTIHEAMTDLIALMNTLVDEKGKILIPGIYDEVAPLTDKERALYENIEFNIQDIKNETGAKKLITDDDKQATLMNLWRYPSLSLHGIEGAFSAPGDCTIIPSKVIGKFSIRLVPDMDNMKVVRFVEDHLKNVFSKRNSPNKLTVRPSDSAKSWITDPFHKNYEASKRAIKQVYGCEPDFTRGGGSIPITLIFQEVIGKNILLLAMGASDDGAHSQNEKINIHNFINGTKVFAHYFHELSKC